MLWQHCRRSLLRRNLRFHRSVGRPTNLEDLFHGAENDYRRPRAKRRVKKAHAAPDQASTVEDLPREP